MLQPWKKAATLGEPMQQTKFKSVVFMGKIASGKGTQAHNVLDEFGGTLYSNGDKMRAAAQLSTPFGKKMKETYEAGYLMPEWVASYWMTHTLISEHQDDLVVFEGVAKKPNEAELFHEIHDWIDRPYVVFHLNVPDDIVRARSQERGRDTLDTKQSIVEKRLEEYQTYTAKSIEFFQTKGTLIEIDGMLPLEEVKKQIYNYLVS